MKGLLLALQFFTAIPITKELPLGRNEITTMYIALPFVGALIGCVMFGMAQLTVVGVGFSPLLAAVFIVLTGIILTGGLHLDGWADTGDAFFSYKDRAKRLEILDDPRLGAFGTMALILLIVVKLALINEYLLSGSMHVLYFVAVPFLARAAMTIYFTKVKLAKDKGIAHFFKEKMAVNVVMIATVVSTFLLLVVMGFVLQSMLLPCVLAAVSTVAIIYYSRWSMNHFGGVSGDLSGAFIEGMEVLVWLAIILLI